MLRETSFRLAGTAEKAIVAAGVFATRETLVAASAGDRRLDGDAIAGPHVRHTAANFEHGTGALVSDGEWILDDLLADATRGVVMDVRAADADGTHLEQHVRWLPDFWIRRVDERHFRRLVSLKAFMADELSCGPCQIAATRSNSCSAARVHLPPSSFAATVGKCAPSSLSGIRPTSCSIG